MKYALSLALIVVLFITVSVQAAENARVTDSAAPHLAVTRVVSPGGITGWLVQDPSLPILSLSFLFKGSGTINDTAAQQGLSTWLAATLDEGAGPYDALSFQQSLSDHAITLGFAADRDDLHGQLRTLTRHQDLALTLLKESLTRPRFEDTAIERMRQKLLAQLRDNRSDPEWQSMRLAYDRSFAGHPYGLNSGGTVSSLTGLKRDDLRRAFADRIVRERLIVAASGAVTPDEFGAILDNVFGDIPPGSGTAPVTASFANAGTRFLYTETIPQSFLTYVFPWVSPTDSRRPAADMLAHILVGGFGSRLVDDLREKRGLTYGISGAPLDLKGRHSFVMMTSVPNDRTAEAVEALSDHLTRIGTHGVTAPEIAAARDYLTGSLPLGLTSTMRIAGLLVDLQKNGHPPDYLDQYAKALGAVDAAAIQALARDYLDPDKGMLAIVGKPEGIIDATPVLTLPNGGEAEEATP